MVELEDLSDPDDQDTVLDAGSQARASTPAARAASWVLDNWDELIGKFVKVMPTDYKRALQKLQEEAAGNAASKRGELAGGGSWVMFAGS